MVDECSFCVEQCSTAIFRDDVILAQHTDRKEMDLCPIRVSFRRKALLFLQTCPEVKFAVSSLLLLEEKVARSPCGSAISKNCSDRACRVVHSSPCSMFDTSLCTIQSKKFCGDFFFSYRLPATHGEDVIMPPVIVIFPQARYNYYYSILTDCSS